MVLGGWVGWHSGPGPGNTVRFKPQFPAKFQFGMQFTARIFNDWAWTSVDGCRVWLGGVGWGWVGLG